MPLRKLKPTTAGQRHASLIDYSSITKSTPEKSLLETLKRSAGRNNLGRITSFQRGGGHKRKYRKIDFKRNKDGIPAKVVSIEYDPNRSAFISLLHYADGEKRYIIAPEGLEVGSTIMSGDKTELSTGNALLLGNIPPGTEVHNVELYKGRGAQIARSAGSLATIAGHEGEYTFLNMPSGEVRKIPSVCRATLGRIGNTEHNLRVIGKAGRNRWSGRRPIVRGSAMNPVAHPMGGGEGRRAGGRPPVSAWGVQSKGGITRNRKRSSAKLIIRRRKKKK